VLYAKLLESNNTVTQFSARNQMAMKNIQNKFSLIRQNKKKRLAKASRLYFNPVSRND
jgi:hypothetical protein